MNCTDCANYAVCENVDKDCAICDAFEKRIVVSRGCAKKLSPFERTKAAVYATGNRWAIENFNATHY